MKESNIILGNIQKLCFHDGPGIRTTVFLKGCSLKCPWCANPENLTRRIQYTCDYDKCNFLECPFNLECNGINSNEEQLKNNLNNCPLNAINKTGEVINNQELVKMLLSIDNYDGITFSGGEPLLQAQSLKDVLKELKKNNINICVETSLFVPNTKLLNIINFVDMFIIDIKILEQENCSKILHGNLELYMDNIKSIFEHKKDVIFRIPVADKIVYNESNISLILEFLKKYKPIKVELFKIHNLAEKKYNSLNLEYNKFRPIDDDKINLLKEEISKLNVDVEIIKF